MKKWKNKFKVNKLFLYAISNLFKVKNAKKILLFHIHVLELCFKKKENENKNIKH